MRLLLTLAIIFILYQVVFRLLIPYFIGRTIRRAQEQMFQQFGRNNQQTYRPEGEVQVESHTKNPKNKKSGSIDGEYVDYIEVK